MSTKPVMGTTATGRPRNRSWPEALKREIVAASFALGSSVSVVARQYDVNANQVFSWRKRYRDGSASAADPVAALIKQEGERAERFTADAHTGIDRYAFERRRGRHCDVGCGPRAKIDQGFKAHVALSLSAPVEDFVEHRSGPSEMDAESVRRDMQ